MFLEQEQTKARLQSQIHTFTDTCWDLCGFPAAARLVSDPLCSPEVWLQVHQGRSRSALQPRRRGLPRTYSHHTALTVLPLTHAPTASPTASTASSTRVSSSSSPSSSARVKCRASPSALYTSCCTVASPPLPMPATRKSKIYPLSQKSLLQFDLFTRCACLSSAPD